jgi:phenylacetic acid degradation operon negative regulatory protein
MTPERNTPAGASALLDRPLTARSVIASLLLRSSPPRMPGGRLVQWCGLFDIPEGTARVALSRMVDRGELRTSDGTYELAGRVRGRRPAQDYSLTPELGDWSGEWRTAVVEASQRDAGERAALRDAMRRLRCAELREGVWTRPDNLPRTAAPADAWTTADAQCSWWRGRPDDDAGSLAARLFDPAGWAARAHELGAHLVSATAALGDRADAALATAFIAGVAALAHIRADPLLPVVLCPARWPGDAFRRSYLEYEEAFSHSVQAWFREH